MKAIINIVYDYFHPAYKAGGPIQSLVNLVDHLKEELCVQVICSNTDHDKTILPVETNHWIEYNGRKIFFNTNGFSNIERSIDNRSVIFINGMYSLNYSFLPALKLKNRKIISARGMLHPNALSQKPFKKRAYLALWKLLRLHTKCEFHATTEAERQDIQRIFGRKTKVWVAQNLPVIMKALPVAEKHPGKLHITTIALISPMKNHLQVIRALANCSQSIVYHIYGPIKDKHYWDTCNTLISQLPKNIEVLYHGDVPPEKVPGILENVHVYVQPSKSENFGHSLYEALACGRPIVTSFNTPWNQLLEAKAGVNVDPDNINELASIISSFAEMKQEELNTWSKAASDYSAKAINVKEIKQQYLQMFANQYINYEFLCSRNSCSR